MTANWAVLHDPVIIARIILQIALFAASAFFSMSETALFSLREADLQRLDGQRPESARRLRGLLDEPRQLIVSILCGNELINIAATVNLAGIFLVLFSGDSSAAALVNTAIMLPLLLLLGEITPKTLAVTSPVMLSTRLIEPIMTVWVRLVMPLRLVVRFIADRLTTLIIGEERSEQNILSSDEFHSFLLDVEEEGVVSPVERRMIVNLIEAGTTPIVHIMVPRPQVAFIDADLPVPRIVEDFRLFRHRRVPLYRGSRDNVVGILKEEKILELVAEKPVEKIAFTELAEPTRLVPTTQTVGELAEFFKEGDHHAALVINEYGGVEGFVSADDVFAFLTRGQSAFFESYMTVQEMHAGVYRCHGLTPLAELRRLTNLPLEETGEISTVGGLVMMLMKRVPRPGDEVRDAGLVFQVLSMDNLLIDSLMIAPEGHPALAAADAARERRERETENEEVPA